ncbi:hypothetical protein P3X83_28565 [Spongiactinospora sp. TRM90649]|nr:YkgJ family cysteine cluster protein [Spongiactinospora sp. TRM90649]MDF5756566.1 hypothetical protein [Spongiactinospora sp. TRM90649]
MRQETGIKIPSAPEALQREQFQCPALDDARQCRAYEQRPMLCRLWGAVEWMPCTFGCRPAEGLLPDSDGYRLLRESLAVGAPATPDDARRTADIEARVKDPSTRSALRQYIRQARRGRSMP